MRQSAPWPLGLSMRDGGVQAAVWAPHAEAVEVCLLDDDGLGAGAGRLNERRLELPQRTHGVWHGWLADVPEGQRYGLRVHGPWDPRRGRRHNPAKLLLDPYARAVTGQVRWGPELFGHVVDDESWRPLGGGRRRDPRDSAPCVRHGVLVAPPVTDPVERPRVPWSETVLYEAHVKGLTRLHPAVPPEQQGTYAALAHPAVVEHLVGLGVTTLELLPIHSMVDEPALVRRGRVNYWGYNSLGFFAPEPRCATAAARAKGPSAVLEELRSAIAELHAAGLEVVLDVVYNHSAEGDADGPTFAYRGLSSSGYYRLDDDGRDVDVTGCGNTLDFREPRVVQLALDSLRYWVQAFGVDGFRFDLAPTLARGHLGYDPDHPFLVAARTDPVLADTKLIAEPWDVGPHGWRTGQFPPPFAEWNDRFRDGVRSFWLADPGRAARGDAPVHGVRDLATRLAGSADLFTAGDRGPHASINFLTAHDGFPLADCTAYEHKHNEANGEQNRDGHNDNRTWNHGVEGWTGDSESDVIEALRRRSMRNLLATLALSAGVPMLTAGDEIGRSQYGNNNAYCLDDETSWLPWDACTEPWRAELLATTQALLALRRAHPVLRQSTFFAGRRVHSDGTTDLAWFAPDGRPMDHPSWHDPALRGLQVFLHGGPVGGDSLLVVVHGDLEDGTVRLPGPPWATSWTPLWDSTDETPLPADGPQRSEAAGGEVVVPPLSTRVYRAVR